MPTSILLNPKALGQVAIIDDDDAERVQRHAWTVAGAGYAITTLYRPKRTISLHRFILNNPAGEVDHRNRNKLDCRKENLRITNRSGNNQNTGKHGKNTTSQYKGVCWHKASNKWAAGIRVNRKRIHLGIFINETDAAHAYDAAARLYHGEFAVTNF